MATDPTTATRESVRLDNTGGAGTAGAGGVTVELLNVSKWFGDKVAISDLTFSVGPGVTALLGANGAGKSTTLKLLTGQLRPSQGAVRVLGQAVADNPALYRRIGLVPEQEGVYPFLTALEFVELAARLHHLPRPRMRRLVKPYAQWTCFRRKGVPSAASPRACGSATDWAQALVHDPEVLLLDEPLSGADPRQRLALMEVFSHLGAAGKTVLISSHILNEVERIGSKPCFGDCERETGG